MTTENYSDFVARLSKDMGQDMNLIHSALGVASDGGEFVDAIKAHAIYGKDLDVVNLIEEAGDVLFFLEMGLQQIGCSIMTAMAVNQAKLNVRYSKGYNDADAKERRKDLERQAMRDAIMAAGEGNNAKQV